MMGCQSSKQSKQINKYNENPENKQQAKDIEFQPPKPYVNQELYKKQGDKLISDSEYQRNKDKLNYPLPNSNKQPINEAEIPKIECSKHKNSYIGAINTNTKISQKLCCLECVIQNQYLLTDLLQIKDVFGSESNQQYLKSCTFFENESQKELFINIITDGQQPTDDFYLQTFISFKKSIIEYIDKYFKEIEDSINRLRTQTNGLKQSFQERGFQNKLKEIFTQNSKQNNSKIEQNINQLFINQQKECKSFEKQVKNYEDQVKIETNKQKNSISTFVSTLKSYISQINIPSIKNMKDLQPENNKNKQNQSENLLQYLSLDKIKDVEGETNKSQDILFNNKNQLTLDRKENQGQLVYYIDYQLNNNDKYEIEVECFKARANDCLYLSLETLSNIDEQGYFNSCLYIQDYYNNSKFYNIEKGQDIHYIEDCKKKIDIQICLKEKVFRWKFNDNINSIKDWTKFNQNMQYYLLLYLHYKQSKIIIKSFSKVNKFEQW